MEADGEAGGEIIKDGMVDKKIIKKQRSIVTVVLSVGAIILIAVSFFIREEKTQNLVRLMGFVFMLAMILFRLFKGDFAYKPTREEIEERMFGNKETGK
jgi:hypothetical protein